MKIPENGPWDCWIAAHSIQRWQVLSMAPTSNSQLINSGSTSSQINVAPTTNNLSRLIRRVHSRRMVLCSSWQSIALTNLPVDALDKFTDVAKHNLDKATDSIAGVANQSGQQLANVSTHSTTVAADVSKQSGQQLGNAGQQLADVSTHSTTVAADVSKHTVSELTRALSQHIGNTAPQPEGIAGDDESVQTPHGACT